MAKSKAQKRFEILGTGTGLPPRILTNAELEKLVDTSDAWITERTGIRERRIVAPEFSTSDLCAEAVKNACQEAQIDIDELDALIVGTSTPDTMFPSTACWVQKKLGVRGFPAFDISAGCTGWLYALEVAANLIAGGAQKIAVCGAEVMSKVIDWEDRSTCVLFGDGAGAAIIGATEEDKGLLASNWGADGNLAGILYQPAGGTQMPASQETVAERKHSVYMEGNSVFRHAVRAMSSGARSAMEEAGTSAEEVDLMIPHQANIRIMEACRERVGVPSEKVFSIVERYGNMSAATVPVALHEARQAGRLNPGQTFVTTAFGTGLTWAAAVVRV